MSQRVGLIDGLRNRLRRWLFPRTSAGVVTLKVELDGYEDVAEKLQALEQMLKRIRQESDGIGRSVTNIVNVAR